MIGLKKFNARDKGVVGALLIDWQHLSLGDLKQYEFFPKTKCMVFLSRAGSRRTQRRFPPEYVETTF